MPRATFKPVNTANLARVFVAILAMDPDDQSMIAESIAGDTELCKPLASYFGGRPVKFGEPNADNLAMLFDAILSTPKEVREVFVKEFDRVLDEIRNRGGFDGVERGTRFQRDPRGSHR